MANFDGVLTPPAGWPDVPQASNQMALLGGPGGPMNAQAEALAARSERLKELIEELPEEVDAAGTAAALIAQHNASATAHPALSEFITQEANRAELAADSAAATGKIFATSAAGQASSAVAVGDYFWVVSASQFNVLELWQKGASAPTNSGKRTIASSEIFKPYRLDKTGPITDNELVSGANGATDTSVNYKRTGFIAIEGAGVIMYTGTAASQTGIAFYDQDKVFISGVQASLTGLYVAPANAKYMMACTRKDLNTTLSINMDQMSSEYVFDAGEAISSQVKSVKFATVDIIPLSTLSPGYIDSTNGNYVANASYSSTDYIFVSDHTAITYSGRTYGNVASIAMYDANKVFLQSLGVNSGDVLNAVYMVSNPSVKYIRVCSSNSAINPLSAKTLKYNLQGGIDSITKNLEMLNYSLLDVIPIYGVADGYIGVDGRPVASSSYSVTPFIPVSDKTQLFYTGRVGSTDVAAIALYDADQLLLQTFSPPVSNAVDYLVTLNNANAHYVRASSSKSSPAPFSVKTQKVNLPGLLIGSSTTATADEITVRFISPTLFEVNQQVATGEYLTHQFQYIDDALHATKGWYSPWVRHKGVAIAQGNFNFIHMVNAENEGKFVGIGHGCEVFLWAQFFVDGEQFDPATATGMIRGSRFNFQFLSEIYVADASKDPAGELTQPATPLQVSTLHYMDCSITKSGVDRYNKLVIKRSGLSFAHLYGAMQQTNQPEIGGTLTFNGPEPFRAYFPTNPAVAVPLPPSTKTVPSDGPLALVNKVKAEGSNGGYHYTIETEMQNMDSSKMSNIGMRSWVSRSTANKFYFIPDVTTFTAAVLGKAATVFNAGDRIEVISKTVYGVSHA
ncbi:hypothetical protein [Aeromonas caviae]|uniref:hypothetical protein n=1 Tax=Aeromonas caviae TaxID=648 RepID=UPI002B483C31|nr:hypothetical protein [Aeromonas caviae]